MGHQGQLGPDDLQYKGSNYKLMAGWESGEVTYDPLTAISQDDPATCAAYARKHGLPDRGGWKYLQHCAKTTKRLIRAAKQSRLRQVRASIRLRSDILYPGTIKRHLNLTKKWAYQMAICN